MTEQSRPRILVVEDQQGPREALSLILRPQYDLRTACDGCTAIHIIRTERIDVVIQDLGLPDYDGLNLLRDIKIIHPDLPVIIMTGAGTSRSIETATKLGAAAYILKPFNFQEVLDLLEGLAYSQVPQIPATPPNHSPSHHVSAQDRKDTPQNHI